MNIVLTLPARIMMTCLAMVLASEMANAVAADSWQQRRIAAWHSLVIDHQSDSEKGKVRLVNEFVNQMQYVDDIQNWGQQDYWATPQEFLAINGGDCEDFAIAKYFTLRSMGVPESRLRLGYVMTVPDGRSHMVLHYYPESTNIPLVLDSRSNQIVSAQIRTDLIPVYSFNRRGYWLSQPDGDQLYLGSAQHLSRWKDVLQRWDKNSYL